MRRPYDPDIPTRIRTAIEEAWGVGCRVAPWHGDERTAMVRAAERAWRRLRKGERTQEERAGLLARALLNAVGPKEGRTKQIEADYVWLAEFIVRALSEAPPPQGGR